MFAIIASSNEVRTSTVSVQKDPPLLVQSVSGLPAAIVYIAVRGRQLYGRKGRCVRDCPHPHSFSQLLTLRYAMMHESPFSNLKGQT